MNKLFGQNSQTENKYQISVHINLSKLDFKHTYFQNAGHMYS